MFERSNVILFVLLLLLFTSSCSDTNDLPIEVTEEPTIITTSPPLRIALVMKTLTNPFFIEMEKGARNAEAEFGIDLIVRTAAQETSIEQQIEIIEELIAGRVDAIVIAPGDSLRLIPVLKLAQDAGIVVINIDNRLDAEFSKSYGLVNVPFISVDNEQGAYLSAKYISGKIDTPTEVIILEGIVEAQNAQDRKSGTLRALEENPNITVVGSESAHWKIDEGYTVTQALFKLHPDVRAIFSANDMMALGSIQFLKDTGKTDVMVAAYDALEEAKEAIREGTLMVTIDQQASKQGYLGIEYAVRALNGEDLPAETMVDVIVVSQETLED